MNLYLQPDITPETTELPEGRVADFQTKYTDIGLEIGYSSFRHSSRFRSKVQLQAQVQITNRSLKRYILTLRILIVKFFAVKI